MSLQASENHFPVMLPEVLEALSPRDGGVYVDGTFGAGGYTCAILDAAKCKVYAIDRDETACARAEEVSNHYGADRFTFMRGCFGDVRDLLDQNNCDKVDGFVLDIGVSSMQIDQADRGFSFREDGPLDMRMDAANGGQTAADIVNTYEENDLADLIYEYGEERKSRRVARAIVECRKEKKITRTGELADIIRSAVPKSFKDNIDPATRTFQALRIAVNDELGELNRALSAADNVLANGGRMVVVSFHSLEDSIVKKDFKNKSGANASASRHLPDISPTKPAEYKLISRKAIKPSDAEISKNARSRSARLRVIERVVD